MGFLLFHNQNLYMELKHALKGQFDSLKNLLICFLSESYVRGSIPLACLYRYKGGGS